MVFSLLRKISISTLFCSIILVFTIAPAQAHIDSLETYPTEMEILDITPTKIEIKFTENIYKEEIQIELYNSDGEAIPFTGKPEISSGNTVSIKPPTLEEGSYAVIWKHKGLDAHTATGQLIFSVGIATEFSEKNIIEEQVNLFNLLTKYLVYLGLILLTVTFISQKRYKVSLALLTVATVGRFAYLALDYRDFIKVLYNFPSNLGWFLCALALLLLWKETLPSRKTLMYVVVYSFGFVLTGHLAGKTILAAILTLLGTIHLLAMVFWISILLAILQYRKFERIDSIQKFTKFIPISIGLSIITGVLLYLIRTKDSTGEEIIDTLTTNYGISLGIKVSLILLVALPIGAVVKGYISNNKFSKIVLVEIFTVVAVIALGGLISNLNANAPKSVRSDSLFIIPDRASACLDNNGYFTQNCLIRYVRAKIATESAGNILAELAELRKTSKEFLPMCHGVTHALGRSSYVKYGSIEGGFKNGYDVCDFGYYHGVVEGAGRMLSDEEFEAKMPEFCENLLKEGMQELAEQCIHGLGHAAALRVNNDLLRGLEMCDTMQPVQDKYKDLPINLMCGTGVTMEWFTHASEAFKYNRESFVVPQVTDPKDSCFLVPEKWKPSCVEYAPNNSTGRDMNHRNTIVEYCSKFDGYSRERCFWGLGRVSFDGVNGSGIEDTWKICTKISDIPSQESCLEGAGTMSVIVSNQFENANIFCKLFVDKNFISSEKVCSNLIRNAKAIVRGAGDGKIKLDQESASLYQEESVVEQK